MRHTSFLARPMAVAIAVGAAITVITGSASASTRTYSTEQAPQMDNAIAATGHAPTGLLRFPDGMVALVRRLPSNSRDLPRLPRGERYAPVVLVVREIHAPDTPLPRPSARPAAPSRPDSASGCTPLFGATTCIYVYGSGLQVIYWTTGVSLKKPPSNPEAFYLINGVVRQINEFFGTDASGFQIDPFGYESTYFSYVNGDPDPLIFGNNTKVCNYWTGAAITSKPCETVHS